MLDILIVDDSATARCHLRSALESDSEIRVVGEAENGQQMRRQLRKGIPNLIAMDIYLRHENGIDLTSGIMHSSPIPILMVTGMDANNPQTVFKALEAGALDVAPKLPPRSSPLFATKQRGLIRMIKNLANVPVVTRRKYTPNDSNHFATQSDFLPIHATAESSRLAVIAASTGGPPVLGSILKELSSGFGSVLVVQHIASGFGSGLAKWLASESGHNVVLVDQPQTMQPNTIYLAADDCHMALLSRTIVAPDHSPPVANLRPAADILFASAAKYYARQVLGIVLTGMGRDGTRGFAELAAHGAQLIVQQKGSCVVSSMPENAKLGIASVRSLNPDLISHQITSFFSS